jgi:hypothetical protein
MKHFITFEDYSKIADPTLTSICPYCGRKISYTSSVVYEITNEHWQPELKSIRHDMKQPYKCNGCGATIKLNSVSTMYDDGTN